MDEQDALEEHSAPRRALISRTQPRGINSVRKRGPGQPRFPQDCGVPAKAATDELASG